jgi:hypothetical protein
MFGHLDGEGEPCNARPDNQEINFFSHLHYLACHLYNFFSVALCVSSEVLRVIICGTELHRGGTECHGEIEIITFFQINQVTNQAAA